MYSFSLSSDVFLRTDSHLLKIHGTGVNEVIDWLRGDYEAINGVKVSILLLTAFPKVWYNFPCVSKKGTQARSL
jgi:hypothetical protein